MAEPGRVEMVGFDEAAANIRRWTADLLPHLYRSEEAQAFGNVVAAKVRSAVPVVSGALAASLGVETSDDALSVFEDIVYAGWVEFGGARGRPYVDEGRYLYPSADDAADEWADAADRATTDSIEHFPWHQTHKGAT
jgi:hypothetical protein